MFLFCSYSKFPLPVSLAACLVSKLIFIQIMNLASAPVGELCKMQTSLYIFVTVCVGEEILLYVLFLERIIIRLCFKTQKQPLKMLFSVSDMYPKSSKMLVKE